MLLKKLIALFKGKPPQDIISLEQQALFFRTLPIEINDRSSFYANQSIRQYYHSVMNSNQVDQGITLLIDDILQLPDYQGALVALLCGSLVENGGNPELAFKASCRLLEQLLNSLTPYCAEQPDSEEPNPQLMQRWQDVTTKLERLSSDEQARLDQLIEATNTLVLPLMTMLMRSENNFHYFTANSSLLTLINQCYYSDSIEIEQLYYLEQASQLTYEDEMIVILPASQSGLVVKAHAINNTFHAIMLLQPLLANHSKSLNIGQINQDVVDSEPVLRTRYNWLTAFAYQDNQLVDEAALLWGQPSLAAQPRKEGKLVLIALEKSDITKRSWDGFCNPLHDAQQPQMIFKRYLTRQEIEHYLS